MSSPGGKDPHMRQTMMAPVCKAEVGVLEKKNETIQLEINIMNFRKFLLWLSGN